MLTYIHLIIIIGLCLPWQSQSAASESSFYRCQSNSCSDEYSYLSLSDKSKINSCYSNHKNCGGKLSPYSAKNFYTCFNSCKIDYCTTYACDDYMDCLKGCTGYLPAWVIALIVIGCLLCVLVCIFCIRRRYLNRKLREELRRKQIEAAQQQNQNSQGNTGFLAQNHVQYGAPGFIVYQQQPIYQFGPSQNTSQPNQIIPMTQNQQATNPYAQGNQIPFQQAML